VALEDAGEAVVQPLEPGVRLGGDHRARLHCLAARRRPPVCI